MRIMLFILLLLFPVRSYATVLYSDTFNSYSTTQQVDDNGWYVGSAVTLQSSGCVTGNCMRISYTDGISGPHSLAHGMSLPAEGYIGFNVKVSNKQSAWPKFLKFFGTKDGTNYSNFTMGGGSAYTSAKLNGVSHGGTNLQGDTQCTAVLDNGNINCSGQIDVGEGDPYVFSENTWIRYVMYWKASTNGNSDGQWKHWINGTLKMQVSNVRNRADSNPRSYQSFTFGDYTSTTTGSAWYLWYDDVVVATTYSEASGGSGGTTLTCYLDADGDGYSNGTSETVVECSTNYYVAVDLTATSGDCDDSDASIHPGATDICGNGVDEDCSDSDATCAASCSYADFYMCTDQTSCENASREWWGSPAKCNTIAEPTDITGLNLVTHGDFTESNVLSYWTLFNSSGVAIDAEGLGVRLFDHGILAGPTLSAGVYRYVANINKITTGGFNLWESPTGEEPVDGYTFYSVGTVTGTFEVSEAAGDKRVYWQSLSSANDVVIDGLEIYAIDTVVGCDTDHLTNCDQTGCEALIPTHYWYGGMCNPTAEQTDNVIKFPSVPVSGTLNFGSGQSIQWGSPQ